MGAGDFKTGCGTATPFFAGDATGNFAAGDGTLAADSFDAACTAKGEIAFAAGVDATDTGTCAGGAGAGKDAEGATSSSAPPRFGRRGETSTHALSAFASSCVDDSAAVEDTLPAAAAAAARASFFAFVFDIGGVGSAVESSAAESSTDDMSAAGCLADLVGTYDVSDEADDAVAVLADGAAAAGAGTTASRTASDDEDAAEGAPAVDDATFCGLVFFPAFF